MKHGNLKMTLSLFFLVFSPLVYAAEGNIDVSIRYYDRRIYYVEQDPILVQLTISNQGSATYRFKLADERVFSVDFDIRTISNRLIDPAEVLLRRRIQNQRVFFREVSVEPGESFSFVEDLRDYGAFSQAGSFTIQAKLYPELLRGASAIPISSNRLSLNLRPKPVDEATGVPLALDTDTNALLARQKMPPDEVVEYMLIARQKEQWEKYFLYLDLEAMISRDGQRRREWQAESEEGRQRMLDRYRTELEKTTVERDISTIPTSFIIETTTYGPGTGEVTVLEKFKEGNYTINRRYTYYLRRRDNIWSVVDYTVTNLGTE